MAFMGWWCITIAALSFCVFGWLALLDAGHRKDALQLLLIGLMLALVSIYNQPF